MGVKHGFAERRRTFDSPWAQSLWSKESPTVANYGFNFSVELSAHRQQVGKSQRPMNVAIGMHRLCRTRDTEQKGTAVPFLESRDAWRSPPPP
jgi:hypothetical protein